VEYSLDIVCGWLHSRGKRERYFFLLSIGSGEGLRHWEARLRLAILEGTELGRWNNARARVISAVKVTPPGNFVCTGGWANRVDGEVKTGWQTFGAGRGDVMDWDHFEGSDEGKIIVATSIYEIYNKSFAQWFWEGVKQWKSWRVRSDDTEEICGPVLNNVLSRPYPPRIGFSGRRPWVNEFPLIK